MIHVYTVVLALIISSSSSVFGQQKDTVFLQKYTQEDGLTSYNIRRILQDHWGFTWIATQDGISRFDSRTFVNYTKNADIKKKICGTDVREIIEDSASNELWVLPAEVGISIISTITGDVIRHIPVPRLGAEDWNVSMLKNGKEFWIGMSTGVQIYNSITQRFASLILPSNRKGKTPVDFLVRSLRKDEQGNIWVAYDGYGLVIYDGYSKNIICDVTLSELTDQPLQDFRMNTSVTLGKGDVLYATSQGLRRLLYSKDYTFRLDQTPCNVLPLLNEHSINFLMTEKSGTILVAYTSGVYRLSGNLNHYSKLHEMSRLDDVDWLTSVLFFYQDDKDNTWLGCQQGLARIDRNKRPFTPFVMDPVSKVRLGHVFTVTQTNGGDLMAGLRNGLVVINKQTGRFKLYDTTHLYQHIFTDSRGVIHISRPDGLFIFVKGKILPITTIYEEFEPYRSYSINSHNVVTDSLVILGTENNKGVLIWNPHEKSVRNIGTNSGACSLASNIVNNIYRDHNGNTWVLSDNVITVLSRNLKTRKIIRLTETSFTNYRLYFDMCEAGGYYWITSYGSGVLKVDQTYRVKQVINTGNGLSNDGVYQIHNVADRDLLVTSNNGLSRIDLLTGRVSCYYANDGLHSAAFEEVSGTRVREKIYAGGVSGFTVIDPALFTSNNNIPRLYFTDIVTQTTDSKTHTTNLLMQHEIIPNNAVQTVIHFAGINYRNPHRTEYMYRILEEGAEWILNGDQNFLQLVGLRPGRYTVQVKAVNEDGYSSNIIQLVLDVQPKWYQTWWFKFLLGVTLVSIAYQIYRVRINQLRREEAIRREIARDLHDDLGSTINSVNIYANLAMMNDAGNDYLKKIKENTQLADAGMRDLIWILNDEYDNIEQLGERISRFARPLCEVSDINFELKIEPWIKGKVLKKNEKKNIYLIIKEGVNNSIKYAAGSKITLNISKDKESLSIVLSDNGHGFDTITSRKGNGLVNMERRSHEIGYLFSIQSNSNDGTRICLTEKTRIV